jgi:hypothetical protein
MYIPTFVKAINDMNYVYTFGPRSSENSVNQSGGPAGFV